MKKILLSVVIMLAMVNVATAKTCEEEIQDKLEIFQEAAYGLNLKTFCQVIKKNPETGVGTWFCYSMKKDFTMIAGRCFICGDSPNKNVGSFMFNVDPVECFNFKF